MLRQPGGLPERFGRIHIIWVCIGIPAAGFQQIDLVRSLDDVREAPTERLAQLPLFMLHVQRDDRLSCFQEVEQEQLHQIRFSLTGVAENQHVCRGFILVALVEIDHNITAVLVLPDVEALMLMSDVDLKPYTDTAYHNEELKSLTRYRFDKVRERAKLKQSVSRLVTILFPELEKLVSSLHLASVYALLIEFPGAKQVAGAHLTHLKAILSDASKGRYGRDMAVTLRDAARCSVGSVMPAKSLELQHTIRLIRELDAEIEDIETAIQSMMDEMQSPITTIPGIGVRMGAMILAEIGDFSRFDSPDKILAYAGMSPSTYQSGQLSLSGPYSHMEKRGSRYLRYALYNATKYVCLWDPAFAAYLAKKRGEGKHYNVALSHAAKKLVRLICALEKSQQSYRNAA